MLKGEINILSHDSPLWDMERQMMAAGFHHVAGIDEAGRGPLAGPVVAAAVVLPVPCDKVPAVNDSKQLSESERESIYKELLILPGVRFGVGIVDAPEIDRLNILRATHLAMRKAVENIPEADFVLVDGCPVKGLPLPSKNVIKGDAKCACIAAASIIAKVTRDRIMIELDAEYPEYGFAVHKGYGVPKHLEALRKYGPCCVHRRSFAPVRELLNQDGRQQLELKF